MRGPRFKTGRGGGGGRTNFSSVRSRKWSCRWANPARVSTADPHGRRIEGPHEFRRGCGRGHRLPWRTDGYWIVCASARGARRKKQGRGGGAVAGVLVLCASG